MSKEPSSEREREGSDLNVRTLKAYRLPDYSFYPKIIPANPDRWWMDFGTNGWANRCLPLRIANQNGWCILNGADFEVAWTGSNQLESIKFLTKTGPKPPLVSSMFGYGVLTWSIPYLFRTPDGVDLMVRGPVNTPKDGIIPLDGIVETDWLPYPFTMNWRFTRPAKRVKFERDEPICMISPVRRADIEMFQPQIRNLASAPELLHSFEVWHENRKKATGNIHALRAKQGHYTRGEGHAGEAATHGHRTKLDVRPFEELEPAPQTTEGGATPEGVPTVQASSFLQKLFRR
jgi:Family of unknown function (DUF6065)